MRLARALNILETDRRPALFLGLLHVLVAGAHSLFDIAATSLLVGNLGPDALPQVYMASAVLLIGVGLFLLPVVDRLDRVRLIAGMLVAFALVLFLAPPFAGRAPGLVYRALYVMAFLMKGLVFLQYWLLAGDVLDLRQAKRLFPVLLGCSLVGGLAASGAASLLTRWLPTGALLTGAGLLLVLGLAPVRFVSGQWRGRLRRHRDRPPRLADVVKGLSRDIDVALSSPLLRAVSASLLLLALLAQVLDYLMGTAAHARFTSAAGVVDLNALTSFYAMLNVAVIGCGAILQFSLANRLLSSVGVTRSQLVAPVTFLAAFSITGVVWLAFGGELASSFFFAVLVSRALQKTLRISIVRTSSDLLFNAVPSERRGRARAVKETLIEPLGVLLGGAFLYAGAAFRLPFLLGGALLLSVAFFVLTIRLKEHYLESLVSVLEERSRFRFAFPSMTMRKMRPTGVKQDLSFSGLRRALHDDEASVRLLAAEVASDLKEPEAASLLVDRYRREMDSDVRSGMLEALGKMLRRRGGIDSEDRTLDDDLDPRVRASGIESLARSGIDLPGEVLDAFDVGGRSGPNDPPVATKATVTETGKTADTKGEIDSGGGAGIPTGDARRRAPVRVGRASARGGNEGRRRALLDLAASGERAALERLVHYLDQGDGATRHLAARALESCGEPAVDVLTLGLWSADVEGRRYVIRALGRIGTPKAQQALLPVLSLEAEEAYYDLVRLEALARLPNEPSVRLLADSLSHRVRRAKRNAHHVLRSAFLAQPGMRLILSNLNHPDAYVRSSAIEALEVRVDVERLGGILPLFEHENPRTIAEHGSSFFQLPMKAPLDVLEELMRHRSDWVRSCAVFAMGRVGEPAYVGSLEERLRDRYELARLNAVEALGRLGDRYALGLIERLAAREPGGGDGKLRDYAEAAIDAIRERLAASVSGPHAGA